MLDRALEVGVPRLPRVGWLSWHDYDDFLVMSWERGQATVCGHAFYLCDAGSRWSNHGLTGSRFTLHSHNVLLLGISSEVAHATLARARLPSHSGLLNFEFTCLILSPLCPPLVKPTFIFTVDGNLNFRDQSCSRYLRHDEAACCPSGRRAPGGPCVFAGAVADAQRRRR